VFLGHSTAEEMIEHMEKATTDLNMRHLLQISMDGPSVNWKFYRLFQNNLSEIHDKKLIDIGSCGMGHS
jgi:hypothetical protein